MQINATLYSSRMMVIGFGFLARGTRLQNEVWFGESCLFELVDPILS